VSYVEIMVVKKTLTTLEEVLYWVKELWKILRAKSYLFKWHLVLRKI